MAIVELSFHSAHGAHSARTHTHAPEHHAPLRAQRLAEGGLQVQIALGDRVVRLENVLVPHLNLEALAAGRTTTRNERREK